MQISPPLKICGKPLQLVLQEPWETLHTQKTFESSPLASGNEHMELKTQTFQMIMSQSQHIITNEKNLKNMKALAHQTSPIRLELDFQRH